MRLITSLAIFWVLAHQEILQTCCTLIDCLQRSEQESSEINCTTKTSVTKPTSPTTKCIEAGVLQVIGEYGVLAIQCAAPFPLDLEYDGFQPTEAVRVSFWKTILPNTTRQLVSYNIKVEIYSNEALYQYYSRLNSEKMLRHSYPRTGKYTLHDVFNKSMSRSLYLFLEDVDDIWLILNSKTLQAKDETNGKYLFPCRPSHLNATVKLSQMSSGLPVDIIKNDSAVGVIADVTNFKPAEGATGYFECTIENAKRASNAATSLNFSIPLSSNDAALTLGFDKLPNNSNAGNLNVYHDIRGLTEHEFVLNIACVVSHTEASLYVIEATSPSHSRLLQEFVLPQYTSMSYSLKTGSASSPPGVFTVQNAPFSGLVFCSSGDDYKLQEYATGFERFVRWFPYGTNWSAFDISNSPQRNHLQVGPDPENSNVAYYINRTYAFKCRIRTHGLVPPAVWYQKTADDQLIEEFVDYNLKDGYSFLKMKVTEKTAEVVCAASFWDRDHWKNVSTTIEPRVGFLPVFNATNERSVTLKARQKNQFIKCAAIGDPIPVLSWRMPDAKRTYQITGTEGVTAVEFSTVTSSEQGIYICVASNTVGEVTETFTVEVEDEDDGVVQIVIIVCVVVLAILAVLGTTIYFRYFRKEPVVLTAKEIESFENGYTTGLGIKITGENADALPYDRSVEVTSENFQIARSEVLGSGAYGTVYRGILRGEPVAIKTVKPNADKAYLKALLSELKIMIYLGNHDHLICLKGANTSDLRKGSILIFVELCPLGSLESYLRNNRDSFTSASSYINQPGSLESAKQLLSMNDLHKWSYEICQGMEYLAEKNVIHGDLATRNVLLMGDRRAKITDFGLSRQLYNYSSYVKKNQEPLPWRWMAVESLRDLTFSCKSDIWSFGIVLWEIYSLAEVPYPGLAWDLDFMHQLESGLRMRQPQYAPVVLYEDILIHCWHSDPKMRPSCAVISKYLSKLRQPEIPLPEPTTPSKTVKGLSRQTPNIINRTQYQNMQDSEL